MAGPTHTLSDVRAALIAQIGTATGDDVAAWSDSPTFPCILVRRTAGTPRTDYGRNTPSYTFAVVPLVSRTLTDEAQDRLDEYTNRGTDRSIWDAVEADRTLAGTCHTTEVGDVGPDQLYEFGGQGSGVLALGAEYQVTVYPI